MSRVQLKRRTAAKKAVSFFCDRLTHDTLVSSRTPRIGSGPCPPTSAPYRLVPPFTLTVIEVFRPSIFLPKQRAQLPEEENAYPQDNACRAHSFVGVGATKGPSGRSTGIRITATVQQGVGA